MNGRRCWSRPPYHRSQKRKGRRKKHIFSSLSSEPFVAFVCSYIIIIGITCVRVRCRCACHSLTLTADIMSVDRWPLNRQHESNTHYFTFEICAYFPHWKSKRIWKNHSMRFYLIISRHLVSGINRILTNFGGNWHSVPHQEHSRRFIDNRKSSERRIQGGAVK